MITDEQIDKAIKEILPDYTPTEQDRKMWLLGYTFGTSIGHTCYRQLLNGEG